MNRTAISLSLSETVGGMTVTVGVELDLAALSLVLANDLSLHAGDEPPDILPAKVLHPLRAELLQAIDSTRLRVAQIFLGLTYELLQVRSEEAPLTPVQDATAAAEAQP